MKQLLRYMNPRNLSGQINMYGYRYSWKQQVLTTVGILVGIILLAKILGLTCMQIIVLVALILILIPRLILNVYMNLYEQKRFMDVGNYIEQMLYSFKRKSKVVNALEDTMILFSDGRMGEYIQKALDYVNYSETEGDVYKEAFEIIESEYECDILRRMHNFMVRVEANGGAYEASIKILIYDRNKWMARTVEMSKQRQLIKRNVTIGVILSLVVIVGTAYMVPKELVDIQSNMVSQISSLILLMLNIILWSYVQCKMSGSWIKIEDKVTNEQIERYYRIVNGSPNRQAYRLNKRKLIREVEKTFPEWLLNLSLLLQTDNVQVAIQRSVGQAPFVLQQELMILVDKIEKYPTTIEPYIEFYEKLNIQDIQSSMRMLYSMSQNGGEDMSEQLNCLVERNVELQNQSEKLKMEDYLAGMGFFVLVPMIIGCIKLVIDMGVLMVSLLMDLGGY